MVKIGRVCRFDLPQVLAALEKHVLPADAAAATHATIPAIATR